MFSATSTAVIGRDGSNFDGVPHDLLPARDIAHLADERCAVLSADGSKVWFSGNADAPSYELSLGDDVAGLSLVPLGHYRFAIGAVSRSSHPASITHLALVDAVSPAVEVFVLPATPSPVAAIAPLDAAVVALVMNNGVISAWTPLFSNRLLFSAAPQIVRTAFLWWDPTHVATAAAPAALYGVGWVAPRGPSSADVGELRLALFSLAANGDLLESRDAPQHIAEHLAFADAAQVYNHVPRTATLLKINGAGVLSFPRAANHVPIVVSDAVANVVLPSTGDVHAAASRAGAPEPCPICFDDIVLGDGEAVALDCGHATHLACLDQCLARSEAYLPKGHRIVFNMSKCPQGCGRLVRHPHFPGSARVADRFAKVVADVEQRAKHDYPGHSAEEIMDGYLHYVCGTCGEPYWGGNKDCAAMMAGEVDVDPATLKCTKCTDGGRACETHGADWLFHKCQYCCNVATDFSLGRQWLCDACVAEKRKEPVWANGADGCVGAAECPLAGQHASSTATAVGCLLCALAVGTIHTDRIRKASSSTEGAATA
jgi:hypothetical protein